MPICPYLSGGEAQVPQRLRVDTCCVSLLTPPRVVVSPAWSSFVGSHARNPCTPPNRAETRHTEGLEEKSTIWTHPSSRSPNAKENWDRYTTPARRITADKKQRPSATRPVDSKPLCSLAISGTRPRSEIKRDGMDLGVPQLVRLVKPVMRWLGSVASRLPWPHEPLDHHLR